MSESDDLTRRTEERHSKRVTAFTIAIARAMGVPREQIRVLARGAFLHDIGKLAIPDRILLKPGKLDDDEMAVMRQHCVHGYQMVKNIPSLAEVCETAHSHHERYDGSGYPQGLRGQEIPLAARIVAVADSLDAIISDLPYRRARSLAKARKEIHTWAGRQFDPEIVEVFLKMPDDIWEDLRKNIDGWIVPPQ
jgi:putative nucleotidyltransferase with HDIG domain